MVIISFMASSHLACLQAGDKSRGPALQVNDSLEPEYRH